MKHPTPNTRLLRAAKFGNTDAVRLCLSEGASLECRNRVGATPILLSVYHKNHAVSALLIELGAKHTAMDNKGRGIEEYNAGLPNYSLPTEEEKREAAALMIASQFNFEEKEKSTRL